MASEADPCTCGKSKSYRECCQRFISGEKLPKTPEQLMRSRYTAYALGGHGEYLLSTWFPITARGLSAEELSEKKQHWRKLEVLDRKQEGDEGMVEFKAYYTPLDASDTNEDMALMHEISEFRRIAGRWFYVGGRVE